MAQVLALKISGFSAFILKTSLFFTTKANWTSNNFTNYN